MTTTVERILRSAAEDLGLAPEGWTALEGDPATGQTFGHRDRPALTVEVICDDHWWSWSTGNTDSGRRPGLHTVPLQPWVCVHDEGVSLFADERAALLAALAVAEDDLPEARLCSTAMLRTRLDVLTMRRGIDVFVAYTVTVPGKNAEPAQPLALVWDYRGITLGGDDVSGSVSATSEDEATTLVSRDHHGVDLNSLLPRLAGLPVRSVTPVSIALERLFPRCHDAEDTRQQTARPA
ncbi:hypothetical protein WDZ11_22250 (plasmid) [Roseomonas mucosa]|uniref:hypothetical protein n=1 Tax=Roseomonas mucosa TaxID=207340 RepID=UPI0030D19C3D